MRKLLRWFSSRVCWQPMGEVAESGDETIVIATLQNEVQRLRAALRAYVCEHDLQDCGGIEPCTCALCVAARAALPPESEEKRRE